MPGKRRGRGEITQIRLYTSVVKMPMKLRNDNQIELLFVAGSSLDNRGRRVLVREGVIENYLWAEDGGIDDIDMKLLGITERDKGHIEQFFGGHWLSG